MANGEKTPLAVLRRAMLKARPFGSSAREGKTSERATVRKGLIKRPLREELRSTDHQKVESIPAPPIVDRRPRVALRRPVGVSALVCLPARHLRTIVAVRAWMKSDEPLRYVAKSGVFTYCP